MSLTTNKIGHRCVTDHFQSSRPQFPIQRCLGRLLPPRDHNHRDTIDLQLLQNWIQDYVVRNLSSIRLLSITLSMITID